METIFIDIYVQKCGKKNPKELLLIYKNFSLKVFLRLKKEFTNGYPLTMTKANFLVILCIFKRVLLTRSHKLLLFERFVRETVSHETASF